MAAREKTKQAAGPAAVLLAADSKKKSIPIWLARNAGLGARGPAHARRRRRGWRRRASRARARKHLLLPGPDGSLAGAVLGLGEARAGDPMDRPELAVGHLAGVLPPGCYHLADEVGRRRAGGRRLGPRRLPLPPLQVGRRRGGGAAQAAARRRPRPRAVRRRGGLARPRPHQYAGERPGARRSWRMPRAQLAKKHGASVSSIVGDDLLAKNFPDDPRRRPRQRPAAAADRPRPGGGGSAGARQVTLVGKGICFDTGGLDIKPASGMLIMKKDMGGAASRAGARAHGDGGQARPAPAHPDPGRREQHRRQRLPPRRRARRAAPGKTVEIGNTDAEGRLVLADALALADEERPDTIASFATLTGAARVALGPELPPFYTDDDGLAGAIAGRRQSRRRSGVAHAALARLRGEPRQPRWPT